MAKLRKEDVFDQSFFDALEKAKKEFKDISREAKAFSKAIKEVKGFKEYTEKVKKATDATNKQAKAAKKVADAEERLAFARSSAGKQHAKTTELIRRQAAENRKLARAQDGAAKSTNRFGSAIKSFLFKANFMANVMSSLSSFLSRQFRKAIQGAINIIIGFDQAMADVKAITGATGEEFKKLRDSAKELGATTKFTAVEVAGLQKEYAKLGLSTQEILNAEEATLMLAAATGTELARSAEVVGITLRQFQLEAKEAGRVVDVMAKALTSSTLDTEKFAESMKMVGPIAQKAGFSLEQTTARLMQLSDAGIQGTMGGTALRQIFLQMATGGKDLAERIKELSMEELGLADATEEVQKRAAAALLVLVDGVDDVDDFTEALINAGGTAEEIAKIQLETLKGKLTILNSAWAGLVTTIGDTEGAIEGTKEAIGTITKAINLLERSIINARENETAYNKGRKEGRRIILQTIPVIGKLFQALHVGRSAINLLDARAKDLDGTIEELGGTFKDAGRDSEAFINAIAGVYTMINDESDIKVENIKSLRAELKDLQDQQKTASFEEIGAINIAIAALQKKIKAYKDAGTEILPELAKIEDKIIDLSKVPFFDVAQQKYLLENIEAEIFDLSDLFAQADEDIKDSNDEMTEWLIENARRRFTEEDRLAKLKLDNEKAVEDEIKELKRDIANEAFNFVAALTARQLENTEAAERQEVISAEEAEEKKLKLRRKAAIIDKSLSLFNIILSTAEAVMNYGKSVVTAPLIPFVVALGAAQAAVVLATPIPQFEKGVKSSRKGAAVVGEKGPELRIEPTGEMSLTPGIPTLTDLKRGTEIVPADITSQILKYTHVANGFEGKADNGMIVMMADKLDRLEQAIKGKPVASSTLTPAGILTATHRGNTTIKKLDQYFK